MTAVSWAASWAGTHIAVSKRPEEGNNVVLLLIRKAEIAAMRIQVLWSLGCRPARNLLGWIAGRAFRQRVSCIVEVNDLLEALEIAIVAISLHKIRSRPLVDIAQGGNTETTVELARAFQASFPFSGLRKKLPTPRSSADSRAGFTM